MRMPVLGTLGGDRPDAADHFFGPGEHDFGKAGGGQQPEQQSAPEIPRFLGNGLEEPAELGKVEPALARRFREAQVAQAVRGIGRQAHFKAARARRPAEEDVEFGRLRTSSMRSRSVTSWTVLFASAGAMSIA
jgi:hypothetical protein